MTICFQSFSENISHRTEKNYLEFFEWETIFQKYCYFTAILLVQKQEKFSKKHMFFHIFHSLYQIHRLRKYHPLGFK